MTVGENIKKFRLARNLTQKQLGELVGASEAYIRAYESGRRNPKPASIEKIATALKVDVDVLMGKEIDSLKAIRLLFEIAKQYNGKLEKFKDSDDKEHIGLYFDDLVSMISWYHRYEIYKWEIDDANAISDNEERGKALIKAEQDYKLWMDTYPDQEDSTDIKGIYLTDELLTALDKIQREKLK